MVLVLEVLAVVTIATIVVSPRGFNLPTSRPVLPSSSDCNLPDNSMVEMMDAEGDDSGAINNDTLTMAELEEDEDEPSALLEEDEDEDEGEDESSGLQLEVAGELQESVQEVTEAVKELFHAHVEGEEGKLSIFAKILHIMLHQGLRIARLASASAVHWMRQGGPWRTCLVTAGGIVSFAVLAGVVAIAVLLLTSTMNAAIASFLMSISMVGVFMAFFFSSVTVIYMGALGFGGLTISSIAFLSVCAVIFFSGWIWITWIIWQGLRKCFQFARHCVAMAGSLLFSISTAKRGQLLLFRQRRSILHEHQQ